MLHIFMTDFKCDVSKLISLYIRSIFIDNIIRYTQNIQFVVIILHKTIIVGLLMSTENCLRYLNSNFQMPGPPLKIT